MEKNKLLFVLLVSVVLLSGCTQPKDLTNKTTIPETPKEDETPVTPPPVTEVFQPLKLEYEFTQSGPNGSQGTKLFFNLWLNEKKDCSGKKAFLGIMQATQDPSKTDNTSMWAKVTIYEDNGTMAVSNGKGKNELAFDDATAANMDFDFFLTLNNMFASAGRNFNSDEIWQSTTPVLLKDVQFGNAFSNISVMKGNESTEFTLPCTEFTLLEQNQGPGEMKACVAKVTKEMPLPFIVSYTMGDQFEFKLVKVSKEKSSAVFYPQCLELVKCGIVESPTQEEYQACNLKNGNLDQIKDEKNCVTKYECRTERERVLGDLRQPPQCQISEALINKAIECRNTGNGNWQTQTDQSGCIIGVTCGEMPPQN